MKILQEGRPQKGWAKEFICTGKGNGGGVCGAKLLVEQDDVFCTYSHCMGETDTLHTFKCAGCGVLTDIAESLPFTPRKPRRSDSGATYTGSSGTGIADD